MNADGETGQFAYFNTEEWRRGEILSANVSASARGLAKLGAYMANKGTALGKTIMSEESWDKFHANVNTKYDFLISMETAFTDGGVAWNSLGSEFYGWMGHGGTTF